MDYDGLTEPTDASMVLALADIEGFNKVAQAKSSAETFAMLEEFYELVGKVVVDAGGKVVKFIGDAALVVFPVEQAAEAVVALEHLQDVAQTIWPHHDGICAVRILAHVGTVTCALAGESGNKRFDVFGSAVNELFLMEPHEFGVSPKLQALLPPPPPPPEPPAE